MGAGQFFVHIVKSRRSDFVLFAESISPLRVHIPLFCPCTCSICADPPRAFLHIAGSKRQIRPAVANPADLRPHQRRDLLPEPLPGDELLRAQRLRLVLSGGGKRVVLPDIPRIISSVSGLVSIRSASIPGISRPPPAFSRQHAGNWSWRVNSAGSGRKACFPGSA